MGGLLAAEAAIDPSNNPDPSPRAKPRRIVAMIAFDTPYLGLHPHVVISGIASLLPKDKDGKKSEREINDHSQVTIVDDKVTDDWETVKKGIHARGTGLHPPPLPPRFRSPSPIPNIPTSSHTAPCSPSPPSLPFVDRALSLLSSHADDQIVRWFRKHADDPIGASKRWTIEHFQFGSCMFDPAGLRDRYSRLVAWQGLWVNYWTQTVPGQHGEREHAVDRKQLKLKQPADKDVALLKTRSADISPIPVTTETSSVHSSQNKYEADGARAYLAGQEKAWEMGLKKSQERREADASKEKGKTKPHHFIVLPTGLGQILGGGERWEKVLIGGVEDEVAAHCGIFIRGQNLDYDGLVERVGKRIMDWCEGL